MLRFFIHDGSTWRLWRERRINDGITPSGTVAATAGQMLLGNPSVSDGAFIVPAGYKIGVATNNAEEYEVHAIGGLL
jgi:hypothetical protein